MIRQLQPWAYDPFEILHAEQHYRVGEDFDRRIAMVGFDMVLFDAADVVALLDGYIAVLTPPAPAQRNDDDDRTIDDAYEMISVGGRMEYASDFLIALDPERYCEVATELRSTEPSEVETAE